KHATLTRAFSADSRSPQTRAAIFPRAPPPLSHGQRFLRAIECRRTHPRAFADSLPENSAAVREVCQRFLACTEPSQSQALALGAEFRRATPCASNRPVSAGRPPVPRPRTTWSPLQAFCSRQSRTKSRLRSERAKRSDGRVLRLFSCSPKSIADAWPRCRRSGDGAVAH